MSVRIAAVGDIHVSTDTCGRLAASLRGIGERADMLLIAGDLTQVGSDAEVDCLLRELAVVDVPIVAVLGNHDHHAGQPERVAERAHGRRHRGARGARRRSSPPVGAPSASQESRASAVASRERRPASFGEIEMKRFVRHTADAAERLERCLNELSTDFRVALLHYSPIAETLAGEPVGIYRVPRQLSAGRGDRSRRCRPRAARPRPPRV